MLNSLKQICSELASHTRNVVTGVRQVLHDIKSDSEMVLDWKRRLVFWSGAITVGLVAILFAVACEEANGVFHLILSYSPYLSLLVTPLGLVAIVLVTRRYFPGSEGSGIPQTIAALDPEESSRIRNSVLSLRVAVGKIFLTIFGLMCGASVGREGPTVQIGAAIMHSLGNLARFPNMTSRKA